MQGTTAKVWLNALIMSCVFILAVFAVLWLGEDLASTLSDVGSRL